MDDTLSLDLQQTDFGREIGKEIKRLDGRIDTEADTRDAADQEIWTEIETIEAASDVVDIVGTYAELQQYDTSHLNDNDIIKVLQDETHDDAITYWRWNKHDQEFSYVGEQGPYYTQDQIDNLLDDKQDTLTAGNNIQINDNVISATGTAYTAGTGIDITNDTISVDNTVAMVSDLPTKTSDLANDGSDGTSTYVEADELATVATTGSYTDLTNTPTIPIVNDATLTIQKNGTDIATFTANSSSNATANITVPTATSDLTNDSGFITSASLPGDMAGATSGAAGTHGLVPAPAAGDEGKFLQGNGTWATVSAGTQYTAGNGISIDANNEISIDTAVVAEVSDIPTQTSDLTNNGSDGDSTYVEADELATVATSGAYSDLTGTPTIPTVNDATLTVTQNGATAGTFTANASVDKTINISVPTTAAEVNALPDSTKYGASFTLSINSSTYTVTATLKDQDGNTLGTAQTIDLPLESVVVNGSYDSTNKKIVLTLQSGSTIDIPVADLVAGLQTEITAQNMLDADYVDDSTSTNKFVTASDKTAWNGKQNTIVAGTNIQIAADGVTISAIDTTYSDFTGASSSVAGAHGLVPAPQAGDQEKVLYGDGTWKDTTAKLVEMSYGESNAWAKFIAAYNAGSIVYCRASSNSDPATGAQGRKAFMAYVNNATTPTEVEFQYVRSVSSKSASQQSDQVFVYKLTNANGGTWTAESRNMAPKIIAGTGMASTFTNGANATITLSADTMTGATSSRAGAAGIVPAPTTSDPDKFLKGDGTWATPPGTTYTAGNHIDITNNVITAEDYVHSESPVSAQTPAGFITNSMVVNGTLTASKFQSGELLQLTLSTTDIGEGAPLAANTLYGVYE